MIQQKLLVIEDDEGVAELQRKRLTRSGYLVSIATNEVEALERLQESDFDLVVLDYMLPGGRNGLEFYEQLKSSGCKLPVIMVTGCNQEAVAIAALRAGVCDYVSKSVEYLDYLPEAVTRVLDRVHMEHSLRQVEAQLRHAQKMEAIGRLAGSVAHDFNNFLSVIIGCSEGALEEIREQDPVRQLIQDVHDAGKRAATLTRQLLTFSRRTEVDPEGINLNRMIEDIAPMLRRVIGKELDLQLQLSQDDCWLWADKGQLDQLLLNLVVNARDAMPNGGCITLQTLLRLTAQSEFEPGGSSPGDKAVRLIVTDTGCGMSEETKSHIFEPFFTTKGPNCGTGLGLATVYGVVRQSGGKVEVLSQPGQGTSFVFDFPSIDPLHWHETRIPSADFRTNLSPATGTT